MTTDTITTVPAIPVVDAPSMTPVPDATPAATAAPETVSTTETKPDTGTSGATDANGQPRDAATGQFAAKSGRAAQIQAQIGELTRQKHEERREVDRLRAEADRIRGEIAKPTTIDPADYAGQTAHEVRKAVKSERLEDIEARAADLSRSEVARGGQILDAQAESMRETIPDIDVIFKQPHEGGPWVTPRMADALTHIENGALVAYHLAKNPAESRRLADLSNSNPNAALIELGRIAAKVSSAPTKRISQAPSPVQTVSGGSGSPGVDLNTASFVDYEKVRMAQMRAAM